MDATFYSSQGFLQHPGDVVIFISIEIQNQGISEHIWQFMDGLADILRFENAFCRWAG